MFNINEITKNDTFYHFWQFPPLGILKFSQNVGKSLKLLCTSNETSFHPFWHQNVQKNYIFMIFQYKCMKQYGKNMLPCTAVCCPGLLYLKLHIWHPLTIIKLWKKYQILLLQNIKCLFWCSYNWLCIWPC